jgi:hypothetical protein
MVAGGLHLVDSFFKGHERFAPLDRMLIMRIDISLGPAARAVIDGSANMWLVSPPQVVGN